MYHIYLFNVVATFNHLYKMNVATIKGMLLFKGNIYYCATTYTYSSTKIKNPLLEIVIKCNGIWVFVPQNMLILYFMWEKPIEIH